jgi:hypothetical protein
MSNSIDAFYEGGAVSVGGGFAQCAISGFNIFEEYNVPYGRYEIDEVQVSAEVARRAFVKSLAWAEGLRTHHMALKKLAEDDEKRSLTIEEYWCDWYDDAPWDITSVDREAAAALVPELLDIMRGTPTVHLEESFDWVEANIRFTWEVYKGALRGPVKIIGY